MAAFMRKIALLLLIIIFAFIPSFALADNVKPKAVDSCGCMKKTHDTMTQAYHNIEQEDDLIWEEDSIVLNSSSSPNPKFKLDDAKTAAKAEQESIQIERTTIKKHLDMIKEGMSNDEHLLMVEEYKALLDKHAKLLKEHNEFFVKFNQKSN